ncbi:hypothetical protein [Bacillus sp. 165]|uniref:hypothetical protein n=1 Tax=Bacillus sp. 165 TaxID=1529117 RepID=UPI001ADBC3C4|nr:hypothetical protein [Bacillus sp. 165]MBO9128568.1 hypothetical protein [Bacillus sp. 165]
MTVENNNDQREASNQYPGLKSLNKLVGNWKVFGSEIEGQVTFEWLEGGFFLMQHYNLKHRGHNIKGIEIIGYERGFGAESPSENLKSRAYDNTGNTFDYIYEVDDEFLTIWGGEKGSPAYYKGKWSEDGNSNCGAWVYPGGGYDSTMTRIK